ncbi:MAG: phosphatidate cytidylyltransferase [Methylotenera sp.]|nr:phosphatidate cytidylyltransferase [Methylotenera sp.]MDO9232312.1 phosphatidate cytidylyltransferase [Methylotenera sp.]MDO9388136.1 phosphatidate cytidylyltransferase [Methylotenera sp.]MDP2102159.1 phosphatidate cytidylyltransferase [Methylotenera sp.]MDP2281119.1 phosphatidate cytidylyltransferase [Methylotenera sp.]
MLRTRVITAAVLIVGILTALFLASVETWAVLTLAIILIGVWEWSDLIKLNQTQKLFFVVSAFLLGLFIAFISKSPLAAYQHYIVLILLGLSTLFWLVIAPIWLITRKTCTNRLMMAMLGLLLLLATWLGFMGLHAISPWLLLATIAAVSIADSAAYFAGKRFGRHKLAPEISPGKTWEGVAGAMVTITLYGAVLCYLKQYSLWLIVGLWLIVMLSIMGDLFESLLKRQAGLKDSGQLLPGHGGILDRIDGLIPTLAIALFCIYLSPFAGLQAHA